MLNHHKHCVIEATGTLIATEDASGELQLHLLDNPVAPSPSQNESSKSIHKENAIRISDQALIAFVKQHASPSSDPTCRYRLQARITGDVNMDGGETQLFEVSQAILKDGETVLRYDPRRLG